MFGSFPTTHITRALWCPFYLTYSNLPYFPSDEQNIFYKDEYQGALLLTTVIRDLQIYNFGACFLLCSSAIYLFTVSSFFVLTIQHPLFPFFTDCFLLFLFLPHFRPHNTFNQFRWILPFFFDFTFLMLLYHPFFHDMGLGDSS